MISNVTDAVLDDVRAWQSRPLDAVYPIVYLDAIHLKLRASGAVQNQAVYVALGINAAETEPTWLSLLSMQTSGEGEVEPVSVTLEPAEHAVLTFAGMSASEGDIRSMFLRVTSQSSAEAHYSESSNSGHSPEVQFSLTMRPNPASGRVTIDYGMPRDTNLGIRMYDVAGRLVRVLAQGQQHAGVHSLVWDGRDESGTAVRGGVYFCKMDVGSWTNLKKMVFLAPR